MKKSVFIFSLLILCSFIGFSQIISGVDEVGTVSEDLISIKRAGKWAFIDSQGKMVINYRSDLLADEKTTNPLFKNGLCAIQEIKDGIPYYGFINTKGETVIPAEYLQITDFENGYAIALKVSQKSRGKSMLGKEIIDNYYDEVLIDKNGNVVEYLYGPKLITLSKGYYKAPVITSKRVSKNLVAARTDDGKWKIFKI
ncbi:WG repeat-containing protein [Abyssalbus ytuae]|uniref:WG repeat-containing protein n=1 Tax=Abyssalbus ytuae TaxID=2926907 RepID=A0A9E6ZXL4_9FLAO|nr:WG repeat-containing protein [Abyssalbus ytuae]UOB17032.1 WG repeat-containing protein [Abyssalbus ytuae]